MENRIYSRRAFINQNTLHGKGVPVIAAMTSCATGRIDSDITHIGSSALEQLRDKYHTELFDHFLPNMDRLVIDHEFGGFMCDIDIDLKTRLSSNKRAWFEGRGIWVYSFLYNYFDEDPHFLEVAGKSKDFILKHQPDDDSFWISSFNREGKPTSGPGDIFGNLYIAEGLAEYAKASGDNEYFKLSKKILLNSVIRYDRPDYIYSSEKEIVGPRVLNHWMIILRNSTQILEQKSDSEIEQLADRCVDAIMNHHLNPEFDLLNVTLTHDLERIPGKVHMNTVSFGLGVQALWIVMFEAVRKKDIKLLQRAQELFKRHVDVASDKVYGGYYWSLDQLDTFTFKLGKTLSLHDEILIGALFLLEHQADEWAERCFTETYTYLQEKFVNSEYPFAIESGDRKLTDHSKGMGIYHHPRHLMLNLLAIERMIRRKDKISGTFNGLKSP